VLKVALVVVAVAGVLGLAALVATMLSGTPATDSLTQPRATAGGTVPEPSGSAEPTAPNGDPPPGSSDGITVRAAVVSQTTIEVVETVQWPDGGPATIELRLPVDAATAAGLTITATPTVESLQVSVDGSAVVPAPRDGSRNTWLVTPPSGAAPRSMEIRYLLESAIVRSVPSTPGRALALLTPISSSATRGLSVQIVLAADSVLNVYCPTASTPATLMCGRLEAEMWTVTPPPGLPLVVAQLDLPEPT